METEIHFWFDVNRRTIMVLPGSCYRKGFSYAEKAEDNLYAQNAHVQDEAKTSN